MEQIISYLTAKYGFKIHGINDNGKHYQLRNSFASASVWEIAGEVETSLVLLRDIENGLYWSEEHTYEEENALQFIDEWMNEWCA